MPGKTRVIVNTDAKNECDDQFAIVHALLTPTFEIEGLIPAHFGHRRSARSLEESRLEVDRILDLMGFQGTVSVANGAPTALEDAATPVASDGSQLIIDAALKDDPRPLYVAFYGPLTDMASALLTEPAIESRDIKVVWIGGGSWPDGGREFNLSNDIEAANVVFRSSLEVWQIPQPVYRRMPVSYAELEEKVAPCGKLGRYLVDQVVEFNETHVAQPMEYRSLGDSPAVGVMMYPDCGAWEMRPAPELTGDMYYVHRQRNRAIRVYSSIDARFIHEDFFAKLRQFSGGRTSQATVSGNR